MGKTNMCIIMSLTGALLCNEFEADRNKLFGKNLHWLQMKGLAGKGEAEKVLGQVNSPWEEVFVGCGQPSRKLMPKQDAAWKSIQSFNVHSEM